MEPQDAIRSPNFHVYDSFIAPMQIVLMDKHRTAPIASSASAVGVKNLRAHWAHDVIIGTWPSYRTITKRRSKIHDVFN